jgi:hypothetical protein
MNPAKLNTKGAKVAHSLDPAKSCEHLNDRVREAIARIRPLRGSGGPNHYTVDVPGWGIAAPTKRELCLMLWHWFTAEPADQVTCSGCLRKLGEAKGG